jgi:hypothetical protein
VPTPNSDLDTKIDDNSHKLAIKHRFRMIKPQVDWYAETLVFLDLETNHNLVHIDCLISEIT